MGTSINRISTNSGNTPLADAGRYSQRLGLISHVYSFTPTASGLLKKVIDGQTLSTAPIEECRLLPAAGWLLNDNNPIWKAIGWLLTLITGGSIVTAAVLTRRVQRASAKYPPTRRNIFETLDGGVASEALRDADVGLNALDSLGYTDAMRLARAREGLKAAKEALDALKRAEKDATKGRKK